MSRFRTGKALGIGATSLATLTLGPLLAPASRTERLALLVAAVPLALLFGAIAGSTPPAPQWVAPVSSTAQTGARAAHSALGEHASLHAHPYDGDHAPGTDLGSPPRATQPSKAALGMELRPGSVEELQHTLPR